MPDETATMQIGELADRTEMSLRTIRHYDEVGLLTPSGRSEGGFRLYTHDDYLRLMVIRRMKPLGFSLDEMAELLRVVDALDRGAGDAAGAGDAGAAGEGEPGDEGDGHVQATRASLAAFVDETVERRAKLERQLAMADEFLELLRARLR
ncbi:MerR family transcriptional regulator [Frigoribacterium sp. RIT-PI-h]|uniref:MerR family transcriptional regulator n=1 Tax=Frigoribacterium sp. RIT-PI-h TaxID=1690245 RepID=UPI001F42022D|nr:MerR family transcriptional regulator [Frigoribacterium sp. RIT-PI-h]